MSACAIPHSHPKIKYSMKHTYISNQLYLHFFQMYMKMPKVVKVTVAMMVISSMDFSVLCF